MDKVDAEIVTIGDELNRGEIVDTNSSWLAERLTEIGAHVRWRTSVTDDVDDMKAALTTAGARARIVVCSGGLGPTDDDRTVDVASALVGVEPRIEEGHRARMEVRYAQHNFRMTPNNLRQVRVPTGAEVLQNRTGAAPGFGVALGAAIAFFMPGVPREMKPMFDDEVVPRLLPLVASGLRAAKRTWRVLGVGESHVDHALKGLLDGVAGATLHFRILFPETLVTVIVRRESEAEAEALLTQLDADVRARLGRSCYGTGRETLAEVVGRRLLARSQRLAVAESCTGGMLGGLITSVPGSSAWFRGGVVAYANDVKTALLGVKPETLAAHGAVSDETAREMAAGARRALGAELGLAITGVAGPGGGTDDKPVGTVHVAVAGDGIDQARRIFWRGEREQVRTIAAASALRLLYDALDPTGR